MRNRSLRNAIGAVTLAGTLAGTALAQQSATPAPDERAAQRAQEQALRDKEREQRDAEQQMRDLERKMRDAQRQLEKAAQELAQLQAKQHVAEARKYVFFGKRARLGVVLKTDADPAVDKLGAKVVAVSPGGPADEAGIKAGDIITSLNGEKLAGGAPEGDEDEAGPAARLSELASDLEDGQEVKVELLRGKETKTLAFKARRLEDQGLRVLVEHPDEDLVTPVPPIPPMAPEAPEIARYFRHFSRGGWDEMEMVALNPDLGAYFGASQGLLVVRAPKDSAYGLRSGDVILKIGDRTPETPAQALRILHSYAGGETVNLQVMRNRQAVTLAIEVPKGDPDVGSLRLDGFAPRPIRVEARALADPT